MSTPSQSAQFLKWIGDISMEDVPLVGGKNTSWVKWSGRWAGRG